MLTLSDVEKKHWSPSSLVTTKSNPCAHVLPAAARHWRLQSSSERAIVWRVPPATQPFTVSSQQSSIHVITHFQRHTYYNNLVTLYIGISYWLIELILHCATATEGYVSNDLFRHSLDDSTASYLTYLPSPSLNTVELLSFHNRPWEHISKYSMFHKWLSKINEAFWIRCFPQITILTLIFIPVTSSSSDFSYLLGTT